MATRVDQLICPDDCVEPWAQVTVLDAGHGDCNVIDFCVVEPEPNPFDPAHVLYPTTRTPSYERFIIDTGPTSKEGVKNITNVLKTYGQPALRTAGPGVFDQPKGGDKAMVSQFLLTHVDDDHCGNAVDLMDEITTDSKLAESFDGTEIIYHSFPEMDPKRTLGLTPRDDVTDTENQVVVKAEGASDEWVSKMKTAGFEILYEFWAQSMVNYRDDLPALDVPGIHHQDKSEDNTYYFDMQRRDLDPSWGAICVTCQMTLEYQGKIGKKTTGMVEVVMGTPAIQEGFTIRDKYALTFTRRSDPDEYTKLAIRVAGRRRPRPFRDINEFSRITAKVAELTEEAENQGVDPWIIDVPVGKCIQLGLFQYDDPKYRMHIVGPLPSLYNDLVREAMIAFYRADDDVKLAASIENRASIISLFRRQTDKFGGRVFSMLFTGDAFERDCNVRSTIMSFAGPTTPQFVDVLKVPHHGSNVTSETEFYSAVRARIYLICARQTTHGSPALKTLQTIAAGFRQAPGTYNAADPPFYLFFSDANTLKPLGVNPSNSRQLLDGDLKPNTDNTNGLPIYNYTCWCLRRPKPKVPTAGKILFYAKNADNGNCRVWFKGLDPAEANPEWVKMV